MSWQFLLNETNLSKPWPLKKINVLLSLRFGHILLLKEVSEPAVTLDCSLDCFLNLRHLHAPVNRHVAYIFHHPFAIFSILISLDRFDISQLSSASVSIDTCLV